MPIIFLCVLMLVIWIRYHINHSKSITQSTNEAFWQRESEANHTRNQNIDSLDYIQIPLDKLPFEDTTDDTLKELQDTLIHLASERIVDLSQFTNTELKLTYGTGNFGKLSQYDSNYTTLLETIDSLASYHEEHGNIESSLIFYEYAAACNSEKPQTYVNLVKLYASQGNMDKIHSLKASVQNADYKNKALILRQIEQELFDLIA